MILAGTWEDDGGLSCRPSSYRHQVSASVKLLAFNFYAIANAASERQKFERNNEMLHQIFTVAAQYADIPIVLAGDFQMEPGMYPSVQLALDHWGWADPLLHTDENGVVTRPATFFQHNAPTDADGQSSIDGILVNRTALTGLKFSNIKTGNIGRSGPPSCGIASICQARFFNGRPS